MSQKLILHMPSFRLPSDIHMKRYSKLFLSFLSIFHEYIQVIMAQISFLLGPR